MTLPICLVVFELPYIRSCCFCGAPCFWGTQCTSGRHTTNRDGLFHGSDSRSCACCHSLNRCRTLRSSARNRTSMSRRRCLPFFWWLAAMPSVFQTVVLRCFLWRQRGRSRNWKPASFLSNRSWPLWSWCRNRIDKATSNTTLSFLPAVLKRSDGRSSFLSNLSCFFLFSNSRSFLQAHAGSYSFQAKSSVRIRIDKAKDSCPFFLCPSFEWRSAFQTFCHSNPQTSWLYSFLQDAPLSSRPRSFWKTNGSLFFTNRAKSFFFLPFL